MRASHLLSIPLLLALFMAACSDDAADSMPRDGTGGEASGGTGGSDSSAAGGTPSGSGGESEMGSGGEVDMGAAGFPNTLHETGLYAEPGSEELAEGVFEFEPRFPLYSDDAGKRRWVWLPAGTQIDTSDPDYWDFPTGTKFWKEFTSDGVRVETRYLEKRSNGAFWRVAYQWNDEQTEAVAVPDGVENASGTQHDIPSRDDCSACHTRTQGEILGFSELQLAYESELLDAADLNSEGWVSEPVDEIVVLPGDELDQDALGYLHVNCGTCHNPTSSVQGRVDMELRLRLGSLSAVDDTEIANTTFGAPISSNEPAPGAIRIVRGDASASAVFLRMNSRGEDYSMPPLGTKVIDEQGSALIEEWINSLPPVVD